MGVLGISIISRRVELTESIRNLIRLGISARIRDMVEFLRGPPARKLITFLPPQYRNNGQQQSLIGGLTR